MITRLSWLFVLLLAAINCHAQTCVADTMARLTQKAPITNATTSLKFQKMMNTTTNGTEIGEIEKAWNSLYPKHPLVKVMLVQGGTNYIDENYEVVFQQPLLWVGNHEQGLHCAIFYFKEDSVWLSHSQYWPGTKSYYTESKTVQWAMTNTICLWRVK
jgi:hypothetical protein